MKDTSNTQKIAILQVADTGPLESLVVMLRSVNYLCLIPDTTLRHTLERLGCDTVLSPQHLVDTMGYSHPFELGEAGLQHMSVCDLYVDVKAHRNGPKVWKKWPRLENKTLWYRINGGQPEHVVNHRGDHGNELTPPCPVLTPNQWYRYTQFCVRCDQYFDNADLECAICQTLLRPTPWMKSGAYACWPPFYRYTEITESVHDTQRTGKPICLIHNVNGWGYQDLVDNMRKLGVKVYGRGSPDGLLPHRAAIHELLTSRAMVHLKSNDAPGYALYEAAASLCPIICSRRLIWRCRMGEWLVPNETCLVFDRETHDSLTPEDVNNCTKEIEEHLHRLHIDHNFRYELTQKSKTRLFQKLCWSSDNSKDVETLTDFLRRYFW